MIPGADFFADGEEVGEDLARVFFVGEGVDGGDSGVVVEIDEVLLGEGADDGTVHHATEDACGVFDRFAASELDVIF